MTRASEPVDLLDLPIFGTPATKTDSRKKPGRQRSGFTLVGVDPVDGAATHTVDPEDRLATACPHVGIADPDTLSSPGVDWQLVARLRVEVAKQLSVRLGDVKWVDEAAEAEGWAIIRKLLDDDAVDALVRSADPRSIAEQEMLAQAVFDAVFRLGRLQPLIDDQRIENILIVGCDRVIVEFSDGTMHMVAPVAESDEELAEFIAFLAGRAANPRSFTQSQPTLHLMLPGGARLAAARDTARLAVVIRRHRVRRVTLEDLVAWGSLTVELAEFLRAAVRAKLSIVVSGEQGVGKTTLLRALCAEIDPWEVIGTFESEYELFLHEMPDQHHVVYAWESREGSGERDGSGRSSGARTMAQQIIDSFRFRLDRQICGEIRGEEVLSVIKLMESGAGSISTTHSGDAHATMRKLISCAMEAGPQISQEMVAAKLADTLDMVVQLSCDVERDEGGLAVRKHRYVDEILHITPGERPRGYATATVFGGVPGQCAVPDSRPDQLMARLAKHGFNDAMFDHDGTQTR